MILLGSSGKPSKWFNATDIRTYQQAPYSPEEIIIALKSARNNLINPIAWIKQKSAYLDTLDFIYRCTA
jgi:hypothetical protein